jgi:hypothetical protein
MPSPKHSSKEHVMPTTVTLPPISGQEFDAILAGLRSLEYLMDRDQLPPDIRGILIDHGEGLGLTQIDNLCQRLNCT